MEVSSRDIAYSVLLHFSLIMLVTLVNPFSIHIRRDFESVAVSIISLPPAGDPALLKGNLQTPAQAKAKEEVAVPIAKAETKPAAKKPDKAKSKPAKDEGYKGQAEKSDKTQGGGTDVSDQIGPGTKFGSVAVDNASFSYPYYFVQALNKIQTNWSNPVAANQPMSCVVYFKIIRSGTVLDPAVEKTSGVPAYDRACLRAIQASSPLPPLPVDFGDDIIGIYLEFPYQP